MVGVGRGAQAGVLIRDAEALERMEKVDTIIVDKTGTLTEGKPSVTSIATIEGQDESELLGRPLHRLKRQASIRWPQPLSPQLNRGSSPLPRLWVSTHPLAKAPLAWWTRNGSSSAIQSFWMSSRFH